MRLWLLITASESMSCDSQYGNEITIPGTIIASPNYPGSYDLGKDCRTTIKFDEKYRIRLEFLNMDIVHNVDRTNGGWKVSCDSEYIMIYDGSSDIPRPIVPRLCGYRNPKDVESTGNMLHILFHTDNDTLKYPGRFRDSRISGFQIRVVQTGKIREYTS